LAQGRKRRFYLLVVHTTPNLVNHGKESEEEG